MAESKPAVQQRSRLFVDRRLQGGIVRRILLHWLTFIAVGTALAVTLRWLTHPTVPLAEQLGDMFADFGPFLVALVALLPVFVMDTIKLTNRFAGPYVRFRQHIRALAEHQSPGRLKFREGDIWCETEDDLNRLFDELQAVCGELRTATARAAPAAPASTKAGGAA